MSITPDQRFRMLMDALDAARQQADELERLLLYPGERAAPSASPAVIEADPPRFPEVRCTKQEPHDAHLWLNSYSSSPPGVLGSTVVTRWCPGVPLAGDDAETDVRQNDLVRLERVMDLLRQAGWGHLSREEVNAVLNAADEIVARGRVTEATDARMDTGSESGAEGEGPQPPKHEATLPSVVDVTPATQRDSDNRAYFEKGWEGGYAQAQEDLNPDADPLREATHIIHAALGYAVGNGGRAQALAEQLEEVFRSGQSAPSDDACLAADWAKWALDSLAIALGRLEALGEDYPPGYEQLDRQARNVVAAIRDRQSTDKKSPAQEER